MPVDAPLTLTLHARSALGDSVLSMELDRSDTIGAALTRCAASLGIASLESPGPRQEWIASTKDGQWYTQGPFCSDERVGAVAGGEATLELHLYPTTVCMHGSPGVLGRGHLCGWC
jgi:hypothetical protein